MLDSDSALRPKKPTSPSNKKGKLTSSNMGFTSQTKSDLTANDYHDKCKDLTN